MTDDIIELLHREGSIVCSTAAIHITLQQARIKELEATLCKLEHWFDTDQEVLDVMGNNERADHMRKLKLIRDTLTGGKDD